MQLPACDLIVLDTEGSELAAIRGARRTIEQFWPVLHLEMWKSIEKYGRGKTSDLQQMLREWGYVEAEKLGKDIIYARGI
jgi:hypothetical protein